MAGTSASVVVVGAINVDLVVEAARLPGPGETVVGDRVQRHGGGKGANAAVAAARAGAVVHLVGAVGADDEGARALRDLAAEGVAVEHVAVLEGEATGAALIVVDGRGENQIAVGAGANAALSAEHVAAAVAPALAGAACMLVSMEIPGPAVAAAVSAAAGAGVPCVLNPAPVIPAVLDVLAHGPLLTPNAGELAHLAALLAAPDAAAGGVPELARAAMRATGAPVVVTLGAQGALVAGTDGSAEEITAPPATVRDTTGAGDTFNGVLAARLADGQALLAAVRAATVAASLSVAAIGARGGMPSAAEIEAALQAA